MLTLSALESGGLKANHRRLILAIGSRLATTRHELQTTFGYSAPTLSRLVKQLEELGLVSETANAQHVGRAGRPEFVLKLLGPPGLMGLVATSIDEVNITLGEFDGVLHHGIRVRRDPAAPDAEGHQWAAILTGLLKSRSLRPSDLVRVIMSIPGPRRVGEGKDLDGAAPDHSGRQGTSAYEMAARSMSQQLGVQVLLENECAPGCLGGGCLWRRH